MIKNFRYNDIILYSKGWYQRSENICEDLGFLFSKIYNVYPKTEREVSNYMLMALDKLYELFVESGIISRGNCAGKWYSSHFSFESEVNKRMRLYNQSRDMAIIYLVLSIFQGLSKNEIKLNRPFYGKKEHFRMGSLFGKLPISMTYTHMNRIAQKRFVD